eukprot:1175184-Rhodomonas_salina.3
MRSKHVILVGLEHTACEDEAEHRNCLPRRPRGSLGEKERRVVWRVQGGGRRVERGGKRAKERREGRREGEGGRRGRERGNHERRPLTERKNAGGQGRGRGGDEGGSRRETRQTKEQRNKADKAALRAA